MNKQITKWNDPEFNDVIRLIQKFFPESKTFIQKNTGISIYQMIDSMRLADFHYDYSCEHFGIPESPDLGLLKKVVLEVLIIKFLRDYLSILISTQKEELLSFQMP